MTQSFVISDLHLGEDDSILTYEKTQDENPLVDKLIEKIKAVHDLPGGGRIPELVLLGDVFDLSLAPFDEVLDSVRKFINQICAADLFNAITYVPGNHDHHMWIQIVEHEMFIKNIAERQDIPVSCQRVTKPGEPWRNTFLDGLIPEESDVTLQVAYPNRVLELAGTRIFMHHGHFCERIWTLMSSILESILPATSIDELEIFNSPFTEFGWYGLGQAGRLSDLVEKIYERKLDGKMIDALMDRVDRWDSKIDKELQADTKGWWGKFKNWLNERKKGAIKKYLNARLEEYLRRKQAGVGRMSEARGKTIAADKELREGVTRYLTKYVEIQDGEKFIFGHTHRHEPAQSFSIDGRTIEIANTGGWVEERERKPDSYLIEITDQAELKSHRVEIP